LTRVCEGVLKKRLKAPSTYRRVSVNSNEKPVGLGDYFAAQAAKFSKDDPTLMKDLSDANIRRLNKSSDHATNFQVFITYDAENSFGAPLRGTALCEYISKSGSDSEASALDVTVDGKTQFDFVMTGLKAGN
jgi:hypothetical protein